MTTEPAAPAKDSLEILLGKVSRMREDVRTVERALERLQKEAIELAQRKNGFGKER